MVLQPNVRGSIVTKKPTAVVIGLAVLTLVGFVIVSTLFGSRENENKALIQPFPRTTPTVSPRLSVSPSPQPGKSDLTDGKVRSDFNTAQTLLDQINTAVTIGDWADAQAKFAEFDHRTPHMPAP